MCSLGPSVDVTRAALQAAKKVVAVINPKVPRTFGDGNIHTSHIDIAIERDVPMHNLHRKNEGSPEEETIGKLIAENLVRDGATLQMGIGGIPDAVLRYCKNHKDLGIHSEMFSGTSLHVFVHACARARVCVTMHAVLPTLSAFTALQMVSWIL